MPQFHDLRAKLQQARTQQSQAADRLAQARERLRRSEAALAAFDRSAGHGNARRRLLLTRQRDEAAATLAEGERELRGSRDLVQDAGIKFLPFSDPRDMVSELSDAIPFLLLPVRLETRFKTVASNGVAVRQLWVRIYPDECSIDSFEATLSEAEVLNARTYWIGIWKAGGIEDQERGAWRGLVSAHGSGRAAWIMQNYQPLPAAVKLVKAKDTDVILVVAAEPPLAAAEEAPVAAFWRALWLADGAKGPAVAALSALQAALGASRAAEIAEQTAPVNFSEPLPAGVEKKSAVKVSVAFLSLPKPEDLDTKKNSWSRAPKVTTLPERFVFLGYQGTGPPLVQIGNFVPSPLLAGPDPQATAAEQLQQKNGEILVPDELQWMVDFDRAVEMGLGLRIDLDDARAGGFDRILVLGVRLSEDEQSSQATLEELLTHHRFSRKGFSLLPQGTPTNNTESAGTGFTRSDDADGSFDDLFKPAAPGVTSKTDGAWLAEFLGIDPQILKGVRHADGLDQAEARAMGAALWPGTLGYWMDAMLNTAFDDDDVEHTRIFFQGFVSGRGPIPAVRIGAQPYGILPVCAFSRLEWLEPRKVISTTGPTSFARYLQQLYKFLKTIGAHWAELSKAVAQVKDTPDAHQTLLNVLGLHPTSVEYTQRYAESYQGLFAILLAQGSIGEAIRNALAQQQAGRDVMQEFGFTSFELPELLSKYFFGREFALKGPLIDDVPLSESEPIRPSTTDKKNYLEWLVERANTSQEGLRVQSGFTGNQPPRALLYLLLRHSLQLGFFNASLRLHFVAGLLTAPAVRAARVEAIAVHLQTTAAVSESRYALLAKTEPAITGNPATTIGDHIALSLRFLPETGNLREQVEGVELLQKTPTARLERLLAEHIDCCTYRYDAWRQGLVHLQLANMRQARGRDEPAPRSGLHLGAYAWLEEVRPDKRATAPVELDDELAETFQKPGEPPLESDSANEGYIHAHSLNQAVTAAVLRNGYLSNASPENHQTMTVNLTSERVRGAMGVLEGIRGGQSLGALLGYRFERGLHDRNAFAEVDEFILKIRKQFPLAGDRLDSTKTDDAVSIDAVEARNVVDGLAFVTQVKTPGNRTYPFGKPLPGDATQPQKDAINAEVERLLEMHDAVADLAIAEGVFQAVQGNYDRVAATLDAYGSGKFPPAPEVVRTPASGLSLTLRAALHLEAGVAPAAVSTPRAQAQPALNRWLGAMLPPLSQIGVEVAFRDAAHLPAKHTVTFNTLGLQPIDLLELINDQNQQAMSELDDRIVQQVIATQFPRPEGGVEVRYLQKGTADLSVFEMMPLAATLRQLAQISRPLRATDLALSGEAERQQDAAVSIDPARVTLARDAMQKLRDQLAALRAAPPADPDVMGQQIVPILAGIARFAVPNAGWGFVHEWRQRQFVSVLKKVGELVARWDGKRAEFQTRMTELAALPVGAADAEKFALLQRAELSVSTTATAPLPVTPAGFAIIVNAKAAAFDAARVNFVAIQKTTRHTYALLAGDVQALLPIEAFDSTPFTLDDEQAQVTIFLEDALRLAGLLQAELDRRLAASLKRLNEHAGAATPAAEVIALQEAAKALFGDEWLLIPEFALPAAPGAEFALAFAAGESHALLDHLENTEKIDFPVDEWLYGIARVRSKMTAWERLTMLARTEPELTPVQLPFQAGDQWLALQFPPDTKLDRDRLLYTAHFVKPFDPALPQCGLLLDEWTEVIPATTATTGIAFHYDRPNNEPPQSMLLVTPTDFRGGWQWADLVDALNETLDLARMRAVEPEMVANPAVVSAASRFLPATVMAVLGRELSISGNLAFNNGFETSLKREH